MTQLSVNVNKIATLRNARGHNLPNLLQVTQDIVSYGARGITIHPRPDERHITKKDAYSLGEWLSRSPDPIEFNIEGYPSNDFLEMVVEIAPHQVTLVPDPPDVITSNAGWKCSENFELLQRVLSPLKENNIRTSIFIDPFDCNNEDLSSLAQLKPDRIELYTEAFAKNFANEHCNDTLEKYVNLAREVSELGIGINAGHDLNQENLGDLVRAIPNLEEVSIGHALICEALYEGLETTIKNYLKILCL